MAELIVKTYTLNNIKTHPNADALEIVVIGGWQVVCAKGSFAVGSRVIYVPPDAVLSVELSDKWGVTKYLNKQRVGAIKLRGEPSFGFIVPATDEPDDVNLAESLGITKFEPPATQSGDSRTDDPRVPKYFEVENWRNYPTAIPSGEWVYITRKIHGTNNRIALVEGEKFAGSHRELKSVPENLETNMYWMAWSKPHVVNLITHLSQSYKQVVLYGEVYGGSVQKGFDYGLNKPSFIVFDILVDGKFLPFADVQKLCADFKVDCVDVIYEGPFITFNLEEWASQTKWKHINEGVVIRPAKDLFDPRMGRVVLKYLSNAYLIKSSESRNKGEAEIAH